MGSSIDELCPSIKLFKWPTSLALLSTIFTCACPEKHGQETQKVHTIVAWIHHNDSLCIYCRQVNTALVCTNFEACSISWHVNITRMLGKLARYLTYLVSRTSKHHFPPHWHTWPTCQDGPAAASSPAGVTCHGGCNHISYLGVLQGSLPEQQLLLQRCWRNQLKGVGWRERVGRKVMHKSSCFSYVLSVQL